MAEKKRNLRNAIGPFYVVNGECISCGAPCSVAPNLVTLDREDSEVGCYFHKQPTTPGEVSDAILAMWSSCIGAYRYEGMDPEIRRRLAELGESQLCDHPLSDHPIIRRNHVRFSLPESTDGDSNDRNDRNSNDALQVSALVVSWFLREWIDGRWSESVTGDANRAEFTFNTSAKYGLSYRYAIEGVQKPAPPSSVYRAQAPTKMWLLSQQEDRTHRPIWIHDVLAKNGALDICWFSADEWAKRAVGQELPY